MRRRQWGSGFFAVLWFDLMFDVQATHPKRGLSSLDETRAHFLASLEHSEDREKFAAFFERHQLFGLAAAEAAALKRDGLAILDKIRNKQIVLSP